MDKKRYIDCFRCPYCGRLFLAEEIKQAKYNYGCPKCLISFTEFKKIKI